MQQNPSKGTGYFRIIGGRWRGRKVPIADCPGLRPTPDRVRETLFNWLAPGIGNTSCLDLFAGSGALGLEALSRGAASVVLVEKQQKTAAHLRKQSDKLGGEAEVHCVDALKYLERTAQPFDIVFLDPPYQSGLLAPAIQELEAGGWLGDDAFIYTENPAREPLPDVPSGWTLWRKSKAGQVGYYLFRRQRAPD